MSESSGPTGHCLLCSTALPWPESGFYLTDLCNSDGTEKCPSNPEANPEAKLQQPRLRARCTFFFFLGAVGSYSHAARKQTKLWFEFSMERTFGWKWEWVCMLFPRWLNKILFWTKIWNNKTGESILHCFFLKSASSSKYHKLCQMIVITVWGW